MYYISSVFIGLSLIHGGPGPNCFSNLLYRQLWDKPRKYQIEAISDPDIKKQVKKV